jgi:DNA polymerase
MDTSPLGYEQLELQIIRRCNEERGVGIDCKLGFQFEALDKQQKELLQKELQRITGGRLYSLDQHIAIPKWLAQFGCETSSIAKSTVARLLRRDDLRPEARRVFELRAEYAHSSNIDGILRNIDPGTGRIFHAMAYAGAPTGRIISHSPNLQNLHREEGDTLAKVRAIMSGDVARIAAFGPVRKVLATCERALIAAPPGHRFFFIDFTAIEYLVICWLAGETHVLEAFESGRDPYLEFGRECVGDVPYARDVGRGVILPRIFGVGEERLRKSLLENIPDLDPDIDVRRFIDLFNRRHPLICDFWDELLRAALAAIKRRQEIDCGHRDRITFLFRDEFLTMRLPSGRYISYPFARVDTRESWRGPEEVLIFKENRKRKKKPEDVDIEDVEDDDEAAEDGREIFADCMSAGRPGFWGGPLAENATQGTARDVMMDAVVRLESAGYKVVLTIHDEIICEVPDGFGSLEDYKAIVEQRPDWAPELPVSTSAKKSRASKPATRERRWSKR